MWARCSLEDGGIKGHTLTPSCESTGITTNCWTIIDRRTLELTKKDVAHPRTGEKLQWHGGSDTIKSNPKAAGLVTYKLENTYTTEVHPLEWKFWAPRQASHLGVWQWQEESLENQTLQDGGIWLQSFDRTWGSGDSTLGGHTQSTVSIRTQGRERWPHGRLKQTYLLVLEGLLQRQEVAVAYGGDKDTGGRSSGKCSLAWALPKSTISPTQEHW